MDLAVFAFVILTLHFWLAVSHREFAVPSRLLMQRNKWEELPLQHSALGIPCHPLCKRQHHHFQPIPLYFKTLMVFTSSWRNRRRIIHRLLFVERILQPQEPLNSCVPHMTHYCG